MNRRTLIAGASAAAALLPAPPPWAQSAVKKHKIGLLFWTRNVPIREAIMAGLAAQNLVEGRTIEILYREAESKSAVAAERAAELVKAEVDVLIVWATGAVEAAKRATQRIPIVMWVADALVAGLVRSIARPEGNLTGVSNLGFSLMEKRVEALAEIMPGVRRLGFVGLDGEPNAPRFQAAAETAARRLKIEMAPILVGGPQDFPSAFAAAAQKGVQGLALQTIFNGQGPAIAAAANALRLPVAAEGRPVVAAGGLMSLGAHIAESGRSTARFVARILAGAKPADLPVEQPTVTYLAVNLKTAKQLGITVPHLVLTRADEIIE